MGWPAGIYLRERDESPRLERRCAIFDGMQGRPQRHGARRDFRFVWFAILCAAIAILSIGPGLSGEGQSDQRVAHLAALNDTDGPMVVSGDLFSEGDHQDAEAFSEPTDEDETGHDILAVHRFEAVPVASQTGISESAADRAQTLFQVRVFSSRGSPIA